MCVLGGPNLVQPTGKALEMFQRSPYLRMEGLIIFGEAHSDMLTGCLIVHSPFAITMHET
uniref:Uncharacterized protein n=1 Tax=Arundo donax TaxID=35708 RepID=A0A0A8Y8D1_ARUDO